MAAIQCPSCKAHISVRGLVDCPLCGTYLNPPHHKANYESPPLVSRKPAPAPVPVGRASTALKLPRQSWMPQLFLSGIFIGGAALIVGMLMPSDAKREHAAARKALYLCQQTIKSLAEYGDADTPPYTQNWGKDDEFYFAWQRGSFKFTNAFGGKVSMSASCIGSIKKLQIEHLTVNAKTVI